MKSLEKELFPEANKLIIDDVANIATATILDEELDPLECAFLNDECVQINTSKYGYITLSKHNLSILKRLIDESEKYYNQ